MSNTVSMAVLVAAIRRRADMRGSTRYSDAEIALEANRSAKHLDSLITKKWGCLYRFAQSDLTTTVSQAYVACPSDFKDLVKLGWVHSSGADPIRLRQMQVDDEWYPEEHSAWTWSSTVPRFDVRALNIWLAPTPTAVYTLRLQYVPVLPTIEDSTPTPLETFAGWDDWVINDVAAKLLIEEQSDAADVSQLRDRVGARIELEASTRVLDQAQTVQSTRYRRRSSR